MSLLRVVTSPSNGARISSKPVRTVKRATCACWAAMLASATFTAARAADTFAPCASTPACAVSAFCCVAMPVEASVEVRRLVWSASFRLASA